MIGARNVTLTGTANLTVSNAGGTIDLVAQAGTIAQNANLTAQTDEGNISFTAQVNIVLGFVDARLNADRTGSSIANQAAWGNVALTATTGTITDAQVRGTNATNLYADGARLEANTGIGVLGTGVDEPIVTELATVAAETDSSGGINLLEDTAVTVGTVAAIPVNLVAADSTTTTASSTAATLSDLTTSGNGSVVLVTTAGTITLTDGVVANNLAISAAGSGNVLVQAQGTNSDVLGTAGIICGSV